jgi:Nucleotidyltransferase domain
MLGVMNAVNEDDKSFRARCDDLLVPGTADMVLGLVDDRSLFAFAICVGSVARGTAAPVSDVDIYAELVSSTTGDVDVYRRRRSRCLSGHASEVSGAHV